MPEAKVSIDRMQRGGINQKKRRESDMGVYVNG